MKTNTTYQESCLDTLAKMEPESLDCVITSPPYWQLRDYGYDGQWGLEPTFQEYLSHLWEMMDAVWRVLKKEGTVWINLGDTYGTQSGGLRGKTTFDPKNKNATLNVIDQPKTIHKSLLLIPHRFAIGCIDRGWIVRNDIIWAKRNAMPESVTDRFSKKHEYMFFITKSQKYYFDLDAVRDAHLGSKEKIAWHETYKRGADTMIGEHQEGRKKEIVDNGGVSIKYNPLGKNPGSVSDFWDIPTRPSKEKHYASYNEELIRKPILAGCPVGGIIYDPFMGTGSTAELALKLGRKFIGSEMSTEYCQIIGKRLDPILNPPVQAQLSLLL